MVTKITELTKEQEAKLPEFRDIWVSLGLSTQKTDRAKANAAIDQMYTGAGLKPPKIRIWLKSPYEGVIAAWWLKQVLKLLKGQALDQAKAKIAAGAGEKVGDQVGERIRSDILAQVRIALKPQLGVQLEGKVKEQLGDPLKDTVRDKVWSHVWNQVKDQHAKPRLDEPVWGQVWMQVWIQLWTQVWGPQAPGGVQLGTQVKAEVVAQIRDQIKAQIEDLLSAQAHCAGLHDANLLGSYDFFGKALGLDVSKLSGLMAAAEHCGWFWPFEGVVVMTEKPAELCRDNKNRLHNEKDMSIKYSDGWGVWAWYGTPVEKWAVTNPEQITIDKIVDEKNPNVRRVLRERFGFQEFFSAMIREGTAKRVSRKKDANGLPMTLFRYDEKEAPVYFVHLYNGVTEPDGSRREFIIGCKNMGDDAWDSLIETYPALKKELKDNPKKFEIIKAAIR